MALRVGSRYASEMNISSAALSPPIGDVVERTFASLVLGGSGPIVVEFMSYGCSHCRTLEPVIEQVAEKLKSRETFFRVNVGLEQALADRYEMTGTPTFLMFADSREVGRVVGPRPDASSLTLAVTQPFAR
jgi:thiol-disulfide isomerase/thioredoxin